MVVTTGVSIWLDVSIAIGISVGEMPVAIGAGGIPIGVQSLAIRNVRRHRLRRLWADKANHVENAMVRGPRVV